MLQEVGCSVILLVFISAPSINPQPNLNEITERLGKSPAAASDTHGSNEEPDRASQHHSSSGLLRHLNSHAPHTDTLLKIIQ